MELRNLKTFQIAATCLNFTKAAKILNFSQPTVTSQIRALEQEIGSPLFFRIGRETFLTRQGHIVKKYAERISGSIEEMKQALKNSDCSGNRKLVIAASETFCTHYFPPIIRAYLKEFPDAGIRMITCNSNEVIDGVNRNTFDIGIISDVYHKSGITNLVISDREDLILIVSRKLHETYSRSDLFARFPFIRYEISGPFREQMDSFIRGAGLNPKHMIETSSLEAVKSAVLNDIGVGLIARNLVGKELSGGQLVEIKQNKPVVKIRTSLIIATQKMSDSRTARLVELISLNWNGIQA